MTFERITTDPEVLGGVPCIRGLRVPVATVVGMVADGMSVDEITAALSGKKGRATGKVAPKYRNPDDPSETWTGRGRKPKWVQAALDAGKSLESLTIYAG